MKKNNLTKKYSGFTLIEIIIAIFIFSLVIISTARVFSGYFTLFQKSRSIQKDLESSQYAMNLMAKSLRTGRVISSDTDEIKFYNYSNDGECIEYRIRGNQLLYALEGDTDPKGGVTWCENNINFQDSDFKPLANTNSYISGIFDVTPSVALVAGKVTFSIKVCSSSSCSGGINDKAIIQTSVSLRNYEIDLP